MPLFKCTKCGVIENTATSNFWITKEPPLCSQCDPAIGKWHGIFDRKPAAGMKIGSDGLLYSPEEVSPGGYFYHMIESGGLRIVGDA